MSILIIGRKHSMIGTQVMKTANNSPIWEASASPNPAHSPRGASIKDDATASPVRRSLLILKTSSVAHISDHDIFESHNAQSGSDRWLDSHIWCHADGSSKFFK
jgi:hypothetical protein